MFPSATTLMASEMAVKVLPSPGRELVTITRLLFSDSSARKTAIQNWAFDQAVLFVDAIPPSHGGGEAAPLQVIKVNMKML